MPQFAKATFFHQVFYLLFLFPLFYLLILQIFLPKLSSVLKIRQKALNVCVKNILHRSNEQNSLQSCASGLFLIFVINKHIQIFLLYVYIFTECLKQDLFNIFELGAKTCLKHMERRLYHQIFLYSFLIKKNNK